MIVIIVMMMIIIIILMIIELSLSRPKQIKLSNIDDNISKYMYDKIIMINDDNDSYDNNNNNSIPF